MTEALSSSQLHNIIASRENYFWWKKGKYTVILNAKSPDKFNFKGNVFTFTLHQADINSLKCNMRNLSESLNSQIEEKQDNANVKWNWIYPKINKQ